MTIDDRVAPPAAKPIAVAIVEDDRSTREGLGLLINGSPGYRCVGTYRSVEEALRCIGGQLPDVLLLDIHLPGLPGSEGVRLFREKYPNPIRRLACCNASLKGIAIKLQAASSESVLSTIRNYVRSVYDKLHVPSKSEAVSKALRNRLIF
jgi:DNA-binding NarL/FixJ family response regulator